MGFQLSRQMYINGQKLFPIISIVIMLFLPLSLNQSATVHATLESTLIGNRYNIPLAIPFEINHGFDSANDEELINQEFDRVISDSPIRSKESDRGNDAREQANEIRERTRN